MKEIAIVILMVCILNTVLLLAHMRKKKHENFDNPSSTYVGDYVSGFSRHGLDRRVPIKRYNNDQVLFQ